MIVSITTYNLHVLGSFPPRTGCLSAPSLLGGLGADAVIESGASTTVVSQQATASTETRGWMRA
jgi:hypothetical protein